MDEKGIHMLKLTWFQFWGVFFLLTQITFTSVTVWSTHCKMRGFQFGLFSLDEKTGRKKRPRQLWELKLKGFTQT